MCSPLTNHGYFAQLRPKIVDYHEVAQETGSKFVRQKSPIVQFDTIPIKSRDSQSGQFTL